ncbi:FmdB family transcriptional regulator [Microbacterium sp. zg.B48]|uniref:FmdB family zinc ribbon protein n=1 Tax=unclassified Microbacterium TaxID=2609290 RepID=UPI00214B16BF|nr:MULTISPECIES: FmdB family zinc ribbon protein [unclassified Microbacterium]MCR2762433.1 FmdB family transcriptional regulator [Microbacterium sp. zg.B48]MCR2810577.1 FmdB family transcriptional regulator [Microbacterium sp. zg.B185]WIM18115.1 zinc ribbon domain-containing protein [Microbacterium sp. zg-B185]
MPTYAYACKECGHRFDAVQSFAEPTLTECPACGGTLRKEYGSIGVTFNGSGFYRTDSRAADGKGSGGGREKKSSEPATSSAGGSSGPSESSSSGASSKPEAKASPAPSGT